MTTISVKLSSKYNQTKRAFLEFLEKRLFTIGAVDGT